MESVSTQIEALIVLMQLHLASVVPAVAASCSCCLFHARLLVRATIVLNGSFFVAGIFAGRAGSLTFLSHTIQNVSKNRPSVARSVCSSVCHLFTSSISLFRCFVSDSLGQRDNAGRFSHAGPDGDSIRVTNRRRRGSNQKEQITES